MNRPIKFRVWVPELKKLLLPKPLVYGTPLTTEDFLITQNGDLAIFYRGRVLSEPDCVAQLFTGVCDKNGNEIYEGDIVKTLSIGGHDQIVFEEGCFMFENHGYSMFIESVGEYKDYEILGNIYENPELLNP